ILDEKETLNLDPHQVKQAETQLAGADSTVKARLPETYQWLLVPEQKGPHSPVELAASRLTEVDALAVRVSKKLRKDETLVRALGPNILRKHLDEVPLWRGDHVSIRQLVEDFGRYLYLPRLSSPQVLVDAVHDGLGLLTWAQDSFAYAESFDPEKNRYAGLRGGEHAKVSETSSGLLVRPEVARRQLDAEAPSPVGVASAAAQSATAGGAAVVGPGPLPPSPPAEKRPRRFHGSVQLEAARVGRDAGRVADEVISHLAGLVGARVKVTLEIEAELPEGASEQVIRTVTENSRTLKFTSHGFETD
ncbi:MAG: AAA+ family ATPase, partial [Candidatus Eremiobacterota bacterium]